MESKKSSRLLGEYIELYLAGKRRGGFIGVNRTFDDDMYYVNYYDENNNFAYCTAYTDTEIVLKRVN